MSKTMDRRTRNLLVIDEWVHFQPKWDCFSCERPGWKGWGLAFPVFKVEMPHRLLTHGSREQVWTWLEANGEVWCKKCAVKAFYATPGILREARELGIARRRTAARRAKRARGRAIVRSVPAPEASRAQADPRALSSPGTAASDSPGPAGAFHSESRS